MARIRTVKPDFFTSEDITDLSPLARLLYIALWCEADREGRMVWKPKTFKMRYLPADVCDIDSVCQELLDHSLIVLYGDGLAFIPTFTDHQHLNPREAASTLAPPNASATRRSRVKHASPPVLDAQVGREGKGREGEGKEESSRPAPALPTPAAAPVLLTLPLNDGGEFPITEKQAGEFAELYPAIDVPQQLRAMKAWTIANPKNRKTRSGVMRFVNSWLARAQNQAPAGGGGGKTIAANGLGVMRELQA